MAKKTRPISELDARMDPAVLEKARKMAAKESLNIRLALLREKHAAKQTDTAGFTQTAAFKPRNRKDMRISALIDYLESLDMGLEIYAMPKAKGKRKEVFLLKV